MNTTTRYDDDVRTDDLLRIGDDRDLLTDAGTGVADAGVRATTVAAVFSDHERAHDAVHQLHEDGFRETWIGRTKYGEETLHDGDAEMSASAQTRIESDNWFMRLFGEGDESLHDALVRHGVLEMDVRRAGSLPPHSAIVTVDGANHPELAAEILFEAGGRIITSGLGESGYGTVGRYAADVDLDAGRASADRVAARSADAASFDDYGRYRAGVPIDESTRLHLRAERSRVETSGSQTRDLDRPVVREQLFIERQPAASPARGEIHDSEHSSATMRTADPIR